MTTVEVDGKKVTSKKKTAKKKAAKKTAPSTKKATPTKAASKSPDKAATSGGDAKTTPKAATSPKTPKKANTAKPAATGDKKMSQLDAAYKVLQETNEEMNCKAMVAMMMEKGYWQPRNGGLTPQNTLNAAIGTEIRKKGKDARFKKTAPGKYVVNLDYKA